VHPSRVILDPSFFDRPTLEVARDLLGKLLVRETGGRRCRFHVDLERHRSTLQLPPGLTSLGAPHLLGEVWIDDAGLVGRVSHEQIERRRQRRLRADDPRVKYRRETITELWDYGIEVSIPAPEVRHAEGSNLDVLKWFAGALWRRRRDYKRDQSADP